jgi:hypothetical protein
MVPVLRGTDTGASPRSRRFGALRARSADGGVSENQAETQRASRRLLGAGVFRRGDENV